MRTADIRAVAQHDARLEADHHVLGELEVGHLVYQRFAVQAVAELMPGVAAIEIAAPSTVSDDLARTLVDLPAVDARLDELLGFLQGKVCRAIDGALLLGGITADHG